MVLVGFLSKTAAETLELMPKTILQVAEHGSAQD